MATNLAGLELISLGIQRSFSVFVLDMDQQENANTANAPVVIRCDLFLVYSSVKSYKGHERLLW